MNPYQDLPDHAFWRKSVAEIPFQDVFPIVDSPFRITENDKIATAGSCFAQHIASHLARSGYNYYVSEQVHPLFHEESKPFNYGVFTARYGNIYTSRQLLQLFDRVYGNFDPCEGAWKNQQGQWVDPFRPQIQPNGFCSEDEMIADRQQHFLKVREAFENLDYFVFTLGLTECWVSREDGAVFPICPGVSGGDFSAEKYEFRNLGCDEVVADTTAFVRKLRTVNPAAKIILTVSPVPLIASASSNHVLPATVLSKSILRVAADQIVSSLDDVMYFPSYEIITGSFNRGRYFESDLRSVTEEGVKHVMSVFMRACTDAKDETVVRDVSQVRMTEKSDKVAQALEVVCDEEALDAGFSVNRGK